jgi:SAM-dependent methyltransferase
MSRDDRQAEFLRRLEHAGLDGWQPDGALDPDRGVWIVDPAITNAFPEDGIQAFTAVDERSFWFRHRNLVIADRLRRHDPPGTVVLEVGSGSGVVGGFLQAKGYTTICVEPHLAGAAAAADRVTASFCGDLQSLRLPGGSVPIVGAFDVIEHLPDSRELLVEMRRVLTPNGLALFTVPAFRWLWSDHDVWNGHYRRYDRALLGEELDAAGFAMVDDTYLFAALIAPALLVRVVRDRLGRDRNAAEIGQAVQEQLAPRSRLVGGAATAVHELERAILRRWRLGFGTSLLGVARPAHKPAVPSAPSQAAT